MTKIEDKTKCPICGNPNLKFVFWDYPATRLDPPDAGIEFDPECDCELTEDHEDQIFKEVCNQIEEMEKKHDEMMEYDHFIQMPFHKRPEWFNKKYNLTEDSKTDDQAQAEYYSQCEDDN